MSISYEWSSKNAIQNPMNVPKVPDGCKGDDVGGAIRIQLDGDTVVLSAETQKRIRLGVKTTSVCGACLCVSWFVNELLFGSESLVLTVSTYTGALGCAVGAVLFLYKNVSTAILRRLLTEPNVILILALSFLNFTI